MWEVEVQQTQQRAKDANALIENITEQMELYQYDNCDQRMLVALPLLKSSIDVAAAATRLLTIDPVQYGSAAEALFRPQLERYMRAVYFASPTLTSDAEVQTFFQDDKLPKRKPLGKPDAKARDVSFEDLVKAVAAEIVRQAGKDDDPLAQGFTEAITLEKRDLHGAVHGGRIVVRRYLTDVLAHNPWALAQGALISAMTAMSVLALSQVAHICGQRHGVAEFRITSGFAALLRKMMPGMPEPTGSKPDGF